jgi:hypothetical protein
MNVTTEVKGWYESFWFVVLLKTPDSLVGFNTQSRPISTCVISDENINAELSPPTPAAL